MNYNVRPGKRSGVVSIPASKSCAHRQLICSALAKESSILSCDGISKDIAATIKCLNGLGADIKVEDGVITINPIKKVPEEECHLYCGESGSTLRFMIPVVGALGAKGTFHMEGLLSKRPLGPFVETLTAHGMTIVQEDELLKCSGQLKSGDYAIPGNISSQYISGLLFALPILEGDSTLTVTGKIESADYIAMTEGAIQNNGISFTINDAKYDIPGSQSYVAIPEGTVEQDWSSAAFFCCMGAMSEKGITISEMNLNSRQGDKEIINILKAFGANIEINGKSITIKKDKLEGQVIDATAIPDLVPTISALAAGAEGTTRIINAGRLRFKESDRLQTTSDMLKALGADIEQTEDGLIINGKKQLNSGVIDAANDHRIAMSAAVAAGYCTGDVTVVGAECVQKSYPDFWKHHEAMEVI